MIVLGIESTAHTFGVSIIDYDKKKVLSNIIKGFTTKSGGMIPAKVADHHVENCDSVISQAITKAKIKESNIELISFSQGPGIGHSLRIGAFAARTLSIKYDIPLIGVNHCIAHLEIGRALTKATDPVLLYVSGANTQVIAYDGGKYRVFGETLDIGVGNFLDSFARFVGLGFPGGPKIYELSLKSKNYIELPYTVKGMDVSFGGLLTHLKKLYKSEKYKLEDLCYSLQETVFAMLLEVSERALAHTDKKELILGGGVACNLRLQEMSDKMCKDRDAKCFVLENRYNLDNAAMIALLGAMMYKEGRIRQNIKDTEIHPYERTDDVNVTWRK
ncbi:bifunctional N(6)-L-threonylcarbamoyladenine synthase/serine/threonine protein kinase [Candidatus Woesearchaeota archaeon]|nr:bifunctional N(6)-L-threonylcarbamoyladenine synthase/serine/threonine protein kinase [Candidatus Woesearchaeota archaeon]